MVGKNLIVQNNGYPADDIDEEEPSTSGTQKESVPDEPHATETGQQLLNQALKMVSKNCSFKLNLFRLQTSCQKLTKSSPN
jgi:hypothetical protein